MKSIIGPLTGANMEYEDLLTNIATRHTWEHSAANGFGQLMKGVGTRMPSGTQTIRPIKKANIPTGRTATYVKFICTIRPQKKETQHTRLTVGGNFIHYPGDVSTPTGDMTSTKIQINATLSDSEAKWLGLNLKDFYLNTPMKQKEYIRILLRLIPREIIDQYQLKAFQEADRHIYFEVSKGMYGLPQPSIIAYKQLKKHLRPHGYGPLRHTPGLWTHITKPICFCLIVNDCGVKYSSVADAQHLINALLLREPPFNTINFFS